MFMTGVEVDQGLFSRDVVGTTVADYVHTVLLLSDKRWDKLNVLRGAEEQPPAPLVDSARFNRRAIYEASSE
jgi:hypothetical protein